MKIRKKLLTGFMAVALAITGFVTAGTESKAAYTPVYTNDYDQYGFDKQGFDKYGIKYTLGGAYNNAKTKMRMGVDDDKYLSNGITVVYNNPSYSLVSVKSNSKNLVAKIISNGDSTVTVSTKEYNDGRKETSTETVTGNTAEIGLYAKKAGTYKIVITTKLSTGALLKKTISIKATTKEPYTLSYANATKLKNSEGQYYTTKFYSVKSGKLTVKAAKGYKVTSIQFANSFDDNGEFKYVTIKSGKKVKLNTKSTRTIKSVDIYTHEGKSFKRTISDTYTKMYDYIFPVSAVKVTYKDTWLGSTFESTTYMYYRK
ncbi:MAG: hypothetical protein IJN92_03330 [Lachnospiraceae bacterium]|nr:hypothetical protein [Lachnospiraceae bacterium]